MMLDFYLKRCWLRRIRFPVTLFHVSTEFRAWTDEQRYRYQERIAILCGRGLVTIDAHVIAYLEASNLKATDA